MSADGMLPDDVRECDVPGNRPGDEHNPACPCHEDVPRAFQCGGLEEHFCSLVEREINGCEYVEPDCRCSDIAEEAEADRDEAAYRRRKGE